LVRVHAFATHSFLVDTSCSTELISHHSTVETAFTHHSTVKSLIDISSISSGSIYISCIAMFIPPGIIFGPFTAISDSGVAGVWLPIAIIPAQLKTALATPVEISNIAAIL
jgi:hypothetical protein